MVKTRTSGCHFAAVLGKADAARRWRFALQCVRLEDSVLRLLRPFVRLAIGSLSFLLFLGLAQRTRGFPEVLADISANGFLGLVTRHHNTFQQEVTGRLPAPGHGAAEPDLTSMPLSGSIWWSPSLVTRSARSPNVAVAGKSKKAALA